MKNIGMTQCYSEAVFKAQGFTPPTGYGNLSEKLELYLVLLRDRWLGQQVGGDCMFRAYKPYIRATSRSDSYFTYQLFCSTLLANSFNSRHLEV